MCSKNFVRVPFWDHWQVSIWDTWISDILSFSHHPTCYHFQWLTPQTWMLCFMGVQSTRRSVTFKFISTVKNQNLVCTISSPFRRSSLSMVKCRTSYPDKRSFFWSDSWLGRTLPTAKLSPWYPQGRSTDYFRLDPKRKFGIVFLLALRTCWCRQDGDPSSNCRVYLQSIRIRSEFWWQLFFF